MVNCLFSKRYYYIVYPTAKDRQQNKKSAVGQFSHRSVAFLQVLDAEELTACGLNYL